ncbi:MAG: hypothetical protein M2R45_02538 [Verrucomicrobia subdivision 3 bacterium]|nr:hypothetical protein [Limisphaerales bacterium]MCS1414254.1 hypothetical protein [Limisphaerales bacterium]
MSWLGVRLSVMRVSRTAALCSEAKADGIPFQKATVGEMNLADPLGPVRQERLVGVSPHLLGNGLTVCWY